MTEDAVSAEGTDKPKKSVKKQVGVIGLAIAIFGAGGSAPKLIDLYKEKTKHRVEHKYLVTVHSDTSNEGIQGAKVELVHGAEPKDKFTDSDGRVTFSPLDNADPLSAHVYVSAKGYKSQNREVTVPPIDGSEEFALAMEQPPPAQQPYTRDYETGSVPSGLGSQWAGPYTLTAEKPADGYEIDVSPSSTFYSVSGDRNCTSNPSANGGWLECSWAEGPTATGAKMQFRLQGHSEWFPPKPGLSNGRLHVRYIPKPK